MEWYGNTGDSEVICKSGMTTVKRHEMIGEGGNQMIKWNGTVKISTFKQGRYLYVYNGETGY